MTAPDSTSEPSQEAGCEFVVADPLGAESVEALTSYFGELAERFDGGFDAGDAITANAEAFTPPAGVFILAKVKGGGATLGCGAVQVLDDGAAEIKRMWVSRDARGKGLGKSLLQALESHAAELGNGVIRLDTNSALLEAIAMYRSQGFSEIEAYNDNPYARHWFEKQVRS